MGYPYADGRADEHTDEVVGTNADEYANPGGESNAYADKYALAIFDAYANSDEHADTQLDPDADANEHAVAVRDSHAHADEHVDEVFDAYVDPDGIGDIHGDANPDLYAYGRFWIRHHDADTNADGWWQRDGDADRDRDSDVNAGRQ
jgi:hypothetical protein